MVASVLTVAAVAAVGALETSPKQAEAHDRVLRLVATTSSSEGIDLGSPGPGLGDVLVFAQALVDEADDKIPVGRSVGECRSVGETTQQCVVTLTLAEGQLALHGAADAEAETRVLAIVGGTGRYLRARGEATLARLGEGVDAVRVEIR